MKPVQPISDTVISLRYWWLAAPVWFYRWASHHWRGVGICLAAAVVFVVTGSAGLALFTLTALTVALLYRKPARKSGWWSQATLSQALVTAGVLRQMTKEPLPMLSYKGKPVHTDRGTTVTIGMPGGAHLGDVVSRRRNLASSLGVPEARLQVWQDRDDPANVVHIQVAKLPKGRTAAVADAEHTDWSRPVVLGIDDQGNEAVFTTSQTHSVLAGATGSGKTVLAHLVVAHAALDPRVRIYGIDGKGDSGSKGWQPLEARCEQFVRGMSADSPGRIEALLTEVTELSADRGAAGDEDPEIVLILEEWATARSVMRRISPRIAERCDDLVTVLLATARSRGIHVILIVQRGTATAFPVDQRANCGQRLVGKFGDRAEAGYVLETLPTRLPSQTGEFALSLDGAPSRLVTVDYLTDAAWKDLCARAVTLRGKPRLALVAAEPDHASELFDILADADDTGLQASAIWDLLSGEGREQFPTAQAIGFELRRHPTRVRRGRAGNLYVWRLLESANRVRV